MKYFVTFDKALKLTGYSVYVQTMMLPGDTVNSTNHVSDLEGCPSNRESTKSSKERMRPTLGVRFSEVSVL